MNLQLLSPKVYAVVRPLLPLDTTPSLYCQGILMGKYPGKVIVDQAEQPGSAWVIKDSWCHLLGDAHNIPFQEGLRLALVERQFIGAECQVLFFMNVSETWREVLNTLVENRQLIETPRYVYVANPEQSISAPPLAEGFELRFIDELLREQVSGELPGDVQKVLDLRQGVKNPDEMAFGYVIMNGRFCAAWAVIDFMVGSAGEIRLVTDTPYRRRGLALAASSATLTYAFSQGLTQILWDVAASNQPSIRTAQKLGLSLLHQTQEHLIIFPETGYLINLAWSYLDKQQFEQTRQIASIMIIKDKKALVQYGHFLLAAAWAGLQDQKQAIHHLNLAIDAGFNDRWEMENCPPLMMLQRTSEWQQVIRQL